MEGTPPQHPEAGSGFAGPPCARTQLRSCPAWSSPLERDGDLRGWVGWRAQRESWQGRERVAELAVEAGGFHPNSHFKNSCWWKEIGRSWLTLRLLSVGVAAVCPIDSVGNGGGWSLQ